MFVDGGGCWEPAPREPLPRQPRITKQQERVILWLIGFVVLTMLIAPIGGYADTELLTRAMPVLKARAANLNELSEGARFLFAHRPLDLDQAASDLLGGTAPQLLAALHAALDAVQQWDQEALEAAVRQVAEAQGVKLGQVAQPLRAALTGRKTSPGIFDVLALLGKEESLGRIADRMAV